MPNQPGNRGNPWVQSLAVASRQLMNLKAVGITTTASTVVAFRETHLCVRVQSTAFLLHQGLETCARNHLELIIRQLTLEHRKNSTSSSLLPSPGQIRNPDSCPVRWLSGMCCALQMELNLFFQTQNPCCHLGSSVHLAHK